MMVNKASKMNKFLKFSFLLTNGSFYYVLNIYISNTEQKNEIHDGLFQREAG